MNELQRDIGRMEATLGNAVENIQEIRSSQAEMRRELGEIKTTLSNGKVIKEYNWKILGSVGVIGGIVGNLLGYLKFILTTG